MNALDDLLKKKTGGSRTASSGSASGEKPVSYVDALLESKKGGNADSQLLYTNALKASQGQSTMQTPYADAAAQIKSGTNNNFFHGIAGIFEKAAAGAKEGLRTGLNEAGYRAQAANPLNAADDAYYKAMWEQTTGRKTGVEIPADTRTQQQKDLDEYMGVADLKNDRARAMQRAAEKGYERLDKEGVKTAFQRDNTYQERVDQRYADLGPKWQRAMSIAESVGNQALPMAGRLIGTALLGEKGGEAFQSFLFFNQASGAAIEEALEDGASWDKALTYGTVIGSIEAATEAAGDMANKLTIKAAGKYLPKEQFTKALIGTLTSSKTMRTVLTLLGQMNGEGLEEVASDLVSPFAKSIYNGKTLGENWMDDVTIRGLWESYLAGAISGGFLSGIDGAVNGRFRAQNESYANETVNAKIEEARASMKENGLFNSETREKIIDAGAELGALETQQQTAAQEAREHMQMIREMQRALRGDVGAQERISRMQEGTYTTGAQNAPVGAQRAQNEGISTTPAAAINIQEGMNNGQSSYHREESGAAYVGSRGQAAEGAEGGLQALAGGRTEVQRGVGTDAQADLRQVTPAQLGIRDGGTETVTVVDAQKLGGEAKSAYDAVRETGLEPVAVRGAIQISNGYANAYTESGRVFFRVDAADSAGNVISPEMLVQHELFHNYASEEVIRATDEVIRESMTAEEYDAMRDAYKADYAGVYDFANMSVDEIERLLTEEIAADAYAGLNWFSGEAPVQAAVRTETERNAPARRTEAQQETTGPPEGRASIVTLPDGKKYVQADRQVIFGNDPGSWADQIEGYINRKIRNGEDVILTTDSGDVLKITKDTAGKASFRNYVPGENGTMRRMSDTEYEAKLNAEAHIDELAQISEKNNQKPAADEIGTNGKPIHGELAKNGWYYRTAWFSDFDGQYYRVTISTADGNNGVVVYNVGKIEKRTSPTKKRGSSDSVTETGARQEKSSSTATIRQTEGNSQEKSSGRASIVVLPDGKKYVQADRQVIFGNDPSSWADQIEGYINRKIRNGEDVILTTDSGDVLKITKDTAGKASFRNYVTDESGRRRPMTDSEYETKLNAEAHIDELAKVSERVNKNARPDETSTDGRPIHGKFAENGWLYREAWFQDFDGQYYKVTISIADGNNGVVVYNVGKMEKRTSPARKHGSSDSVTETGAQQEKSSSTATIRQTEGNSQEKSSGRASVAGIRARTADRETLRRAEAMEKGGTDNETIRQETGWYRGMDGQWRFEIDDGDATFSRNGEAQYSTDNADYARYTQLMNRMLTGNLTEAEHAELLGLDKKHGGTKKELARRIDEGDATLRDIMQHNALFEAYPEIAETKVKFAYMPNGTAGSYSRETNTITIDAKLKYDANEALDVLMHEVQHRVQAAEGFASGTNPGYWNRGENYDRAAEKYRDNRARLLNGLSTEDRALYDEYRSTEREMGAMFDGSMLYDESRMDALEKRSDELYKQLYGKEWFGKLNRYDRILGDAGEAVNEFYRNTAGEIEARDTASRRRMTAEERKNTPPNLGDADTVFADGNATSYSIDENFGKNVDDWVRNTPTDMLSTSPGYFRAGTTSEALQSIGARTDNIYMRKSKIGTIFEDHPEVNVDVIKKVPSILENPVLIMKSLTRPDSIVLLSEEKAKNGNSLMVALELTPKPGGRTEAEFSLVTSAYGRADENLRNLINNSELLYLDTNKNRANTWLMQLRVQFPSRQPPYGSIGNIAYAEDGVKITGKKLSELGGVIQKASSGKASVEVENRKTEVSEEDARRERLRKLQEADRRETERIRARENRGAGQRFVPNKSSGEVYRDLMGEGKSEVKVQMTGFLKGTPKDSTFKVEVKQTPIGKYYEATIFHDGHKADTLVRALKETAARDAAEEVITMANKNFSEENYQRAKKFEAEKTADEDARIAELFGDPEQPDNAETSRESSDAAETENAAAKETIAVTTKKVTYEVLKAERNYREEFEKITSGAMRMFVNAGDTVRRIAKATGSKSLEGYYFNAGAYSQRAGNWIARGGARTDIDGHKIGASLADTLAPMRENETKYRDFQLYLLHMHNVDRMKYDNSAELERIKENLRWVKEKYPQLKELSKEELRRIASSDSDSPVVRQAAHEIYLAAHNGEAPSLTSVAEGAAYALELERQRAIVEKQGLKPVFGYDVTADDSQTAAQLLAAKNPEFKEWAKEVYKYSDDLIRYRVEAGLITREFADALKKRYPHYIPTFREEGTNSRKARSARRNGGIVVSNAIGRAVGSDGVLLPLHTALSRKTVSTMRNAGLNQFGLALVREYDGNKKATEKYIWDVAESEYTPTEAALESDEDYKPVFQNVFSVKENGKAYDITMDEGLTAAMKAFEPDKFANYGAAKAMKKLNDVFKAMNTAWSPWFLVKNAVRDFQDAGFYSTDMKTWLKMFPQAKRQIRKNGEIWQQYKALGGSYSSMLDYTTGMVKEPKNKLGKLWARFELLQQQVEAAPRLAEFMTILANSGGSKDGKFTQNDLMEAMLGAADITTNFARGGSVTKMLNRYLVPFLNPSVQGFDKFIRNATGVRSVQAAGKLILSAALWGILPQILNELMWWDDDEWDDIPASTKSNYYLIKLPGKFFGDGYWIKIPKGRAVAVLGTLAVYGKEKIEGEDVKFSDVFEVIKSNIAPTDIFNQNIATAFTQTKLLNPDNPGTTWYGGNIESDRLQNYRPGERYDEKTDEFSKWLGKTFNVSPKKINYLLDQYTGVFGDILLPMMTPATSAASKLLSAPMAAFTIDTTSTNKTTGEYYDLLDDLKYDANDGDVGAGITRKYVSRAGDEVNDYYAQIRALQNDKNLSDGEKNRLVRALKKQLIERQKEIIAKAEPYREAVDKYLKAHPELATDNDAAIAEYAELYDITEDQAESRMDAIVYRECNREVFGAEYALRTYNADVYDKARTAYAKGVSYETYYDYYFATKEMHADKDENGKSISGSKKAKVVEYINSLDIPAEQKDALYVAAGYTEKSAKYQKWNGGSGGSGSRRGSSRKTTLKAPTPKAGKIVIPEASAKTGSTAKTSGNALAPSSKTAKTSGNVIADFTQKSSGTDIRKAVTQAKKRAIKAGNRTLYVEEGSPIDYFLKYGKLPSVK